MAGLFLHHRDDAAPAPAWAAAVEAQFARHGFAASTPLALPGWRGLHVPYIASPLATCRARHGTLVAVAGTIAVDGRFGEEALAALPDAVGPRGPDWSRVAGQFAAVVSRGGRTWLFTDYLGAFPLYHDAGRGLFSTSLLALTEALPRVAFDPQGVHEWVFNVATTGDDTVFAGIRTLGPGTMVELTPGGAVLHPLATPLADGQPHHRVEQHRDVLASVVAPYVAAFERVRAPLSGGIDARLVLAALRREGAAPEVYVYGPEASADVRIARAIGRRRGFRRRMD